MSGWAWASAYFLAVVLAGIGATFLPGEGGLSCLVLLGVLGGYGYGYVIGNILGRQGRG